MRPEGALLSAEALFPGGAQARMAYRMMGADELRWSNGSMSISYGTLTLGAYR